MPDLNRFYRTDNSSERVIGTYLYPHRIFDRCDWNNPVTAINIIKEIRVGDEEVLITCNGGLFIRPPASLSNTLTDPPSMLSVDLNEKRSFEVYAANLFNRVICELALNGIVSEPATPVHISAGNLIENHALITSAVGGREIYPERTTNPSMDLLRDNWRMHPIISYESLEIAAKLECSTILFGISENIPPLVVGAYSLFSQHQLSEALIDAWVVIEQIIDWMWAQYKLKLKNKARTERLSDTRTYSAGVRIEILHSQDIIPQSIYEDLNLARKYRNELAHRAKINLQMTSQVITTLKQMIEFVCKRSVEPPYVGSGINW